MEVREKGGVGEESHREGMYRALNKVIQHCINVQLPSNIVPNVTDTSCLPVDVE